MITVYWQLLSAFTKQTWKLRTKLVAEHGRWKALALLPRWLNWQVFVVPQRARKRLNRTLRPEPNGCTHKAHICRPPGIVVCLYCDENLYNLPVRNGFLNEWLQTK